MRAAGGVLAAAALLNSEAVAAVRGRSSAANSVAVTDLPELHYLPR